MHGLLRNHRPFTQGNIDEQKDFTGDNNGHAAHKRERNVSAFSDVHARMNEATPHPSGALA